MLWISITLGACGLVLLLVGNGALIYFWRTQRRKQEALQLAALRRSHAPPYFFLSYTVDDYKFAEQLRNTLEERSANVTMMQPENLWDDPVANIAPSIRWSSAVGLVEPLGPAAAWVSCEKEIAKLYGTPVFILHRNEDVSSFSDEMLLIARTIDWQKRLADVPDDANWKLMEILRRYSSDGVSSDDRPIDERYAYGSEHINYLRATDRSGDEVPFITLAIAAVLTGFALSGLSGLLLAAVYITSLLYAQP